MKAKRNTTSLFTITPQQQILVFSMLVVLLAGLFGVLGLVGNFLGKPPVATYQDCVHATGSKLAQSYPEICVSKDGKRFQNPQQLHLKPSDS